MRLAVNPSLMPGSSYAISETWYFTLPKRYPEIKLEG
jgi:hypothetical protein